MNYSKTSLGDFVVFYSTDLIFCNNYSFVKFLSLLFMISLSWLFLISFKFLNEINITSDSPVYEFLELSYVLDSF